MKLTKRNCPECGEPIKFSRIVPEQSFIIEGGKIIRDDIHKGLGYNDAYMDFYCSNDREHNINVDTIVYEHKIDKWQEEIINEFYHRYLHAT